MTAKKTAAAPSRSVALRTVAVTFVVAFASVFLTGITGILDALTSGAALSTQQSALVSLVVAALASGVRAVIMYLTAFTPADAEHGRNLVGRYR